MIFNLRPLKYEDYDKVLVGWWKDWDWTPPTRDFLPDDGKGGLILFEKNIPVCAGFIYNTNSKVVWVDWIISNKEYKDKEKRKKALELLIASLTNIAKDIGGKYTYALIKHPSLTKVYEEVGYIKGDSYNSEMIKSL